MTLKEYKKNLDEFVKKHPELLDKQVIYGIDEEGNGYEFVCNKPIAGRFENEEFDTSLVKNHGGINAVCIN